MKNFFYGISKWKQREGEKNGKKEKRTGLLASKSTINCFYTHLADKLSLIRLYRTHI